MRDSPDYERAIVAALSAFVRRKAKRRDDLSVPWGEDEAERDEIKPSFPIQAALYVLAAPRSSSENTPDLRDSDLRGARLRGAQLQGASFRRAYLHKAELSGANLSRADLTNSDLKRARLTEGALTDQQLAVADNRDKIIWVPRETKSNSEAARDDESPDPL
jgi:hypothetical protein